MATPREQLADALKQARADAGFTSHGQLAKIINASRSALSRAENPREAVPSDGLIRQWARATNTDAEMLLEYARRARYPRSWFAVWADDFEQRATLIRWFDPLLVPGLCQTENYARGTLAWKPNSADAEANLAERLARQSVLDRAELRVLILGSVLHRGVGGADVMSEQTQHLIDLGERANVMLGIVPDTSEIVGALGGAFAIATESNTDTAAYSGSLINGTVHTDAGLIQHAVKMFDGLRADALPWSQTRDFLVQAGERWTN
jgi:transcriptional regulator with XRE-family HTH domain